VSEYQKFRQERIETIKEMGRDSEVRKQATDFVRDSGKYGYTYNFEWMGRPIIQFPQDMVALQEVIWRVKPDLIIETGIAHGGSLVFSASMLELLGGEGQVLGVDIDIRAHNREAIESHPMAKRISMIQGSSIDPLVVDQVKAATEGKSKVMVLLDSMHSHDHVLSELQMYSPLVSKDSYLIVFDTSVEDMPEDFFPDRPWGKGDNPKTAVWEFLKSNKRFEIDEEFDDKLLITVAHNGFLRKVKD